MRWEIVQYGERYRVLAPDGAEWTLAASGPDYMLEHYTPAGGGVQVQISGAHGLYYVLDLASEYINHERVEAAVMAYFKTEGRDLMPHVKELSLRELNRRRKAILDRVGMSYEELAAKAAARSLVGDEWAAWEEIREIDFLRKM